MNLKTAILRANNGDIDAKVRDALVKAAETHANCNNKQLDNLWLSGAIEQELRRIFEGKRFDMPRSLKSEVRNALESISLKVVQKINTVE